MLFSETMSCEGAFSPEAVDADPVTRIARHWTRYWVGRAELNEEFTAAGFRILHQYFRGLGEVSGTGANLVTYAERPVERGRSRRAIVDAII